MTWLIRAIAGLSAGASVFLAYHATSWLAFVVYLVLALAWLVVGQSLVSRWQR